MFGREFMKYLARNFGLFLGHTERKPDFKTICLHIVVQMADSLVFLISISFLTGF